MKALMFNYNLARIALIKSGIAGRYFCVKYSDRWPLPEIRHPGQVLVKTIMGGICASDIHQMEIDMSMYASVMSSPLNPSPLGHEAVGVVSETGKGVRVLKPGDKVVYNPVPHCASIGLPPCPSCKKGNYQHCDALVGIGDGESLGTSFGGSARIGGFGGGGFSEYIVGFEKQFHRVPPGMPDSVAVLTEPFTIALHTAARHLPGQDDTAVVVGAGIIGLLTIAALRLLGSKCRIISLARYPAQADMALRMGATEIIRDREQEKITARIASLTDGTLVKPLLSKKVLYGNRGPDIIFDTVATEASIDGDLRIARSNGKIVLTGMGFNVTKKVDWSLQVWKEIDVVGSLFSGRERSRGKDIDAFPLALQLMSKEPDLFDGLVTHTFPIERYREAIACFLSKKKRHAIKVAFDFRKLNIK